MTLYPNESIVNTTIVNDLPQVSGNAGARAYPTRPNTRDAVWDKDENYVYFRVTDSTNTITSLERYAYTPAPEPKPEDIFAKREDIAELKGEISDVKQYIQELTATIASAVSTGNQSCNANGTNNGAGKPNKNRRNNSANTTGQHQSGDQAGD